MITQLANIIQVILEHDHRNFRNILIFTSVRVRQFNAECICVHHVHIYIHTNMQIVSHTQIFTETSLGEVLQENSSGLLKIYYIYNASVSVWSFIWKHRRATSKNLH